MRAQSPPISATPPAFDLSAGLFMRSAVQNRPARGRRRQSAARNLDQSCQQLANHPGGLHHRSPQAGLPNMQFARYVGTCTSPAGDARRSCEALFNKQFSEIPSQSIPLFCSCPPSPLQSSDGPATFLISHFMPGGAAVAVEWSEAYGAAREGA